MRYRFLHVLRDRDGLVRVPGQTFEAVHKLREVRVRLLRDLGHVPSRAEVAQAMGMSVRQVGLLELDDEREQVVSLHALVGDEVDDEQEPVEIGFVALFQQSAERDRQRQEALEQMVRDALEIGLTRRQREVVMRWYGIDQESQKPKQIGEVYGITGEGVGGAEKAARQKLAVSLAVPYGKLCGRAIEIELYTADQAAAVLGMSRYQFTRLARKAHIACQPAKGGYLASYARQDVERLAACQEEWSA